MRRWVDGRWVVDPPRPCATCGDPLPKREGLGRPFKYCEAHRAEAYRERTRRYTVRRRTSARVCVMCGAQRPASITRLYCGTTCRQAGRRQADRSRARPKLLGHRVAVSQFPEEWQPVARLLVESRREIRSRRASK